jgi:VWFA-related protein
MRRPVRKIILLVAIVFLSGIHVPGQTPATPPPATVRISFTALDKSKQAVTTLSKEKVRLLEDDVPQEITGFERDAEQPLSLVIMLDTSATQQRALPNAKLAALGFIENLMRQGKDEAAIITFTGQAMLERDFTRDVSQVKRSLDGVNYVLPLPYIMSDEEMKAAASSALWDALWLAANDVLSKGMSQARRGILILTDGSDTASRIKMKEALNRAMKADAAIFVIGIGVDVYGGVDQSAVREVAEKTGGKFFLPEKISDLPEVFAEIKQQLSSPYIITYTSTGKKKNNSLRRVKIEITDPVLRKQDLKLFYKRGYPVE